MLPSINAFDRDGHVNTGSEKSTPFRVLLSAFGHASAVASIVCFYFCVSSTCGAHWPVGNVIQHWIAWRFLLWSMPSPAVLEKTQEKTRGGALRGAMSWLWQGQCPGERALSKIKSKVSKASVFMKACASAAVLIPLFYLRDTGNLCIACSFLLTIFFGFDAASRVCGWCFPQLSPFIRLSELITFAVVASHRVIPREVASRPRLSAATAAVLIAIGLLFDTALRRILRPWEPIFGYHTVGNGAARVLRGLRGVTRASALWLAFLLTDHALDPFGRLAHPRSERHFLAGIVSGYGPRPSARVCAVYVTSFVDSPRRDSVIPSTCAEIEKGFGVKCTVLDGPSMLDFPEGHKHQTLTLLVASGLVDQDYLIKHKCKERNGECLVPGPRFDGRYNHIDNFLTHMYAFMKFVTDHALDDPLCTALVLEDDVTVASGFARSIEADLASLVPNSYDLISLEAPENICKHYFQDEGIGMTNVHRVSNAHRALGRFMWPGIYAGGYMVSATGASRLIRSLPGTSNIDTWFNALSFWGSLRVLVRCPELVMQGSLEKYGGAVVSLAAREGPKFDKGRWVETKAVKHYKQSEVGAVADATVNGARREWRDELSNRFYAELHLMHDRFRDEQGNARH